MQVPELIGAIRDVAATVPGIGSVHYPAPNTLEHVEMPALVLYWGAREGDTVITHQSPGDQLWMPVIKGDLLLSRLGETQTEFAEVDALLTLLVDAFGVDVTGLTVIERNPQFFGRRVYQCLVDRLRPTMGIRYAGLDYYGAEIFWSSRLNRETGSA
jgi:hypothetical protein